jgi:hypothetical protein
VLVGLTLVHLSELKMLFSVNVAGVGVVDVVNDRLS